MTSDFDDLEEKIKKARGQDKQSLQKQEREKADNESRYGVQAGIELVAAIGAGAAIGYFLDNWLETKPLFIIVFLLLGIATGFYNVYRITQNLGTAVGVKPEQTPLQDDEKDAK